MHNKLHQNPHKEWKPRNKQAAIVVSRASWLHHPPHEPEKAVRLPTPEEEHVAYRNELRKRVEAHDAEEARLKAERKTARPKPKEPQKQKCTWAARWLKRLHKQRGLPPPTAEQIRAYQQAQPNYGQPKYRAA